MPKQYSAQVRWFERFTSLFPASDGIQCLRELVELEDVDVNPAGSLIGKATVIRAKSYEEVIFVMLFYITLPVTTFAPTAIRRLNRSDQCWIPSGSSSGESTRGLTTTSCSTQTLKQGLRYSVVHPNDIQRHLLALTRWQTAIPLAPHDVL